MDKTVDSPLSHIPEGSLNLRLARSTIRMQHGTRWGIDKLNPVHDLVICLSGCIRYEFFDGCPTVHLRPGDAMLIPAYCRFRGTNAGDTQISGIAQHFSLDVFRQGDLIQQMKLERAVSLRDWHVWGPLVTHFYETAPPNSTTLAQHHQFMSLLLAFFEAAFLGWQEDEIYPERRDRLSMQVLLVAARLAADPLGAGVDEALAAAPYNDDYFRRAFKDKIGMTPRKYRERKRMEFAANRLAAGLSVKSVAAELGYSDPYLFSRVFKRSLGASPSTFRATPEVTV